MPPRKKIARKKARPRKAAKRGKPRRKSTNHRTRAGWWLLFWPFLLLNKWTRKMSWPVKWSLRLGGHPAIAGAIGLALLAVFYGLRAQRYDLARIHEMPERSIIMDRHGREIGRIHGEKRSVVPLGQVSEYFRKAILAREDERFYRHGAVDPIGLVRAVIKNIGGKKEGASTITQQLASDVFGLKEGEKRSQLLRMVDRKFLEIAIAHRIEFTYEKDEILEAYINQINWGRQIKGIGEAARIYFEKHPAELDLSESAMLAGIVRGPDAFNPFSSMAKAERERNTTLARMVAAQAISQEEADAAKGKKLGVRPKARRRSNETYAMNAIRSDLEIILEEEDIDIGGLEITTTIDMRVQKQAVAALDARLTEVEKTPGYRHITRSGWKPVIENGILPPTPYIQGAAVVIENRTGGVLAIVGGRDVQQSRYNRAKHARRQVGSTFKPFVYLAAYDRGWGPQTMVSDGPLQPGEIKTRGGRGWNPKNSDGKFGGMFPTSYGLIRSRNTMSVRVGDHAGMSKVQNVAKLAGFREKVPNTAATYLGSFEATPWELATAYSIFPNEGVRYRPYLISEIKDRDGNILYSTSPISYLAAKPSSARQVSGVLQQVAEHGTAASVKRLGFLKPCAGKTGTTDDFKDAWFAGYSSQLTCVVWVGLDQPKRTMYAGYGSFLALPVWAEIMKSADQLGYKAGRLHDQSNLKRVDICKLSGKRATSGCAANGSSRKELLPGDTMPGSGDLCPLHPARAIAIDPKTGQPIAPKAQPVTSGAQRAIPVR